MSTIRSSSGEVATRPAVPTLSGGGAPPPPPIMGVRSMPVAQLNTSNRRSPPTPTPPAPSAMPPPELPRRSSTLLRSPALHRIGRPSASDELQVESHPLLCCAHCQRCQKLASRKRTSGVLRHFTFRSPVAWNYGRL
jgi:hypothetical protein